tara:strand:- start:361 stop:567 length:207 start_codon:yes stop_codon:yes gene_type:complete
MMVSPNIFAKAFHKQPELPDTPSVITGVSRGVLFFGTYFSSVYSSVYQFLTLAFPPNLASVSIRYGAI